MRIKLLAITILLISSQALFSQIGDTKLSNIDYLKPREYEIGGITVSGTKYLDKNVLVHLSGLKVGNNITIPGDDITKAINKLWNQRLFGDVEISATKIVGNKIFLDIELKERPRLSKFAFTGVKKGEAEDLRDEIKLVRGSHVTDDILNVTKNKIKKFYVAKGFYNTDVNISQKEDSLMPNMVILTINVDKKERIKINDIYFEGNTVLSDNKLRRTMKDTKRKKWYNLFKASKYIDNVYEEDKKKVLAKYNKYGYRDAAIVSDSVTVNDEKTLNLHIKIDEGNQYFFRDIDWVGNTKYSSELLTKVLSIDKGDIFNQTVLDKRLSNDEDAVSSLYLDRGYLFFQAVPVEVNVEEDSIDLEIRIYEGQQARINDVIFTGNTRTNDHVIRRELRTYPGELFSRADIIRTHRELAGLGYFDPEKLDVKPVPDQANGTVDIEYVLEERASDQIELSAGWGGYGFMLTLGLSFNNFSMRNIFNPKAYRPLPTGDGQKLSIQARTSGLRYQNYSLSFTEPWLGGRKPNSLTASIYHSIMSGYSYYEIMKGKRDNKKNMKMTGVSVGLGRRLTVPDDNFSLYNELSYQRYRLNDYRVFTGFAFTNGVSNIFSFKTILGRRTVDSPIYPRSGSDVSVSLAVTPPYSSFKEDNFWKMSDQQKSTIKSEFQDSEGKWIEGGELKYKDQIENDEYSEKYRLIEFHKWKFKSDWYTQIVNKLVLRTQIEFGYLGYYSKNLGYSPFESFALGGDGMVNSAYFGTDIVPLRGYGNGNRNEGYSVGALTPSPQGNVYDKFVMELRYPITLNPSATIYGLVFAEAGKAWYNLKDYNPFEVYRSVGVGMRFFLPMIGLLGVNYGYALDPVHGNPDAFQGFSFSIGQQF